MNNPIIMHVNYCEQGQTIEEMCKKAVKWGFDGIEFRAKRAGVDETREDYIDEVARAQKVSGLKYVLFSLNMVNVMDPCPGKRKGSPQGEPFSLLFLSSRFRYRDGFANRVAFRKTLFNDQHDLRLTRTDISTIYINFYPYYSVGTGGAVNIRIQKRIQFLRKCCLRNYFFV